jgi:hydrogenase/urease accessory protein HupE
MTSYPNLDRNSDPKPPSPHRLESRLRVQVLGSMLLLLACFWPASCLQLFAHDPGLSTATIQLKPTTLEAVIVLAVADAAQIVKLDTDGDGQISKDELLAGASKLKEKAADALEVTFDEQLVPAQEIRCEFDELKNATIYLKFPARSYSKLVIRSKWIAVLPPGHRQFLTLKDADDSVLAERLLAANMDTVTVEPDIAKTETATRNGTSFVDFLLMGIRHIWTGYDHLLFLFGLLLVTRNFASAVKIITCFTIAHSITLAVATLSLVHLSSRIVEPLIAASIVYVGVENLFRGDDPKGRWILTFAFGLIHGFGFASVLRELGVGANGGSIGVPLVSFNLGVEIGQIVIAGLILPVIWKLRANPWFLRRWVPVGSVAVTLLGSYWFVQRVWF